MLQCIPQSISIILRYNAPRSQYHTFQLFTTRREVMLQISYDNEAMVLNAVTKRYGIVHDMHLYNTLLWCCAV